MDKIINYDNLRYFAYTNADLINGEVKGIVLDFQGLGFSLMYNEHTEDGISDAQNGIIHIVPYYNPWSWMNKQTVNYIDEIVDVLIDHFKLSDDVKIVASGGSMGGMCALIYTYYAKRTPIKCVTNCPVCDMVYHYTERPDLPRTIYSAFGSYEGTLDEALRSQSPLHLAENMPDIEYVHFHCTADSAVNYEKHGVVFSDKMKECGKNYKFITVPDREHCSLGEFYREYFAVIRAEMV